MTEKPKVRIVVDEEATIVERLDRIAEAEGIARADVLRRAIRRLLFSLSTIPARKNFPAEEPIND